MRKLARAVLTGEITTPQFAERMRDMTGEELDQLAHELRLLADRAQSGQGRREKRTG